MRGIIIAGGMRAGQDFSTLAEADCRAPVSRALRARVMGGVGTLRDLPMSIVATFCVFSARGDLPRLDFVWLIYVPLAYCIRVCVFKLFLFHYNVVLERLRSLFVAALWCFGITESVRCNEYNRFNFTKV